MLLEAGANPDIPGESGYTPLIVAASSNYKEVVAALIEYGATVDIANNRDYSAVHLASWDGFKEVVEMLLAANCKHDTQTEDKNTPLALACHGNQFEIVQILLPLGCDVNNSDKDLDTPILYAAYNGCAKTIKILLENGANPNLANAKTTTPLWNAVFKKHEKIVYSLLQEGVDLDVATRGIDQHAHTDHVVLIFNTPVTPLEVAFKRGLLNVGKVLMLAGSDLTKETWLWEGNYPHNLTKDKETMQWVLDTAYTPLSLKRQCRTFIKKTMKMSINERVSSLEIPATLKDFLVLKYL